MEFPFKTGNTGQYNCNAKGLMSSPISINIKIADIDKCRFLFISGVAIISNNRNKFFRSNLQNHSQNSIGEIYYIFLLMHSAIKFTSSIHYTPGLSAMP